MEHYKHNILIIFEDIYPLKILKYFELGNNLFCIVYDYIDSFDYFDANSFLANSNISERLKISTFRELYSKLFSISSLSLSYSSSVDYP